MTVNERQRDYRTMFNSKKLMFHKNYDYNYNWTYVENNTPKRKRQEMERFAKSLFGYKKSNGSIVEGMAYKWEVVKFNPSLQERKGDIVDIELTLENVDNYLGLLKQWLLSNGYSPPDNYFQLSTLDRSPKKKKIDFSCIPWLDRYKV